MVGRSVSNDASRAMRFFIDKQAVFVSVCWRVLPEKYLGVPPEGASVRKTSPFEGQKPGTSGKCGWD